MLARPLRSPPCLFAVGYLVDAYAQLPYPCQCPTMNKFLQFSGRPGGPPPLTLSTSGLMRLSCIAQHMARPDGTAARRRAVRPQSLGGSAH